MIQNQSLIHRPHSNFTNCPNNVVYGKCTQFRIVDQIQLSCVLIPGNSEQFFGLPLSFVTSTLWKEYRPIISQEISQSAFIFMNRLDLHFVQRYHRTDALIISQEAHQFVPLILTLYEQNNISSKHMKQKPRTYEGIYRSTILLPCLFNLYCRVHYTKCCPG